MSNPWQKNGLAGRFFILIFVAVSLLLAAGGFGIYRSVLGAIHKDVEHRLTETADRKSRQIEAGLEETRDRVAAVSRLPEVASFIDEFGGTLRPVINTVEYEVRHTALRTVLKIWPTGSGDLLLLSTQGEVLFSLLRSDPLGKNYLDDSSLAGIWMRAKALLQPQRSDFRYDSKKERLTAWVVAPVVGAQGMTGAAVLRIHPGFLDAIALDHESLGETAETLIVAPSDEGAVYLTPTRHDPNPGFPQEVASEDVAGHLALSTTEPSGFGRTVDYRGQAVIARWIPLASVLGGLLVKIDAEEVYAQVHHLNRQFTRIGLVAFVVVTGLAFTLARSITRPLRAINQSILQAGKRNFSPAENNPHASPELQELGRSFRTLSDQLQTAYREMDEKTDAMKKRVTEFENTREALQSEITHLKEVEQLLNDSNRLQKAQVSAWASLAQQNSDALLDTQGTLEQFSKVASHDLQEPLRIISGYTQLLAQQYEGKLGANADQFINQIVDGVQGMKQTINDLASYVDASLAETQSGKVRCKITTLIEKALANLRSRLHPTKEATVTYDLVFPTLVVDGPQIICLFEHLIDNGLKFCNGRAPTVHISCEETPEGSIFSVRDNGIGIAPQYFDQIFKIFQRLHPRETYRGTGMGLAIAKRIVENEKGRIWVESVVGEGSSFKFLIPRSGK
jgi:signal transduction histidine kinase